MIAAIFALGTRKAGTVVGGLAAFAALTVVFVACINALVQSAVAMIAAAEAGIAFALLGWWVPVNAALCLATVVSAKICRGAYDLGRKKTDIVVYGN